MTHADLPPPTQAANRIDQVFRQKHTMRDVEAELMAYGKLCARQALEWAAISAWSTGMDEHNKAAGLPCDARTTGSRCAAAIRAIAEEYKS